MVVVVVEIYGEDSVNEDVCGVGSMMGSWEVIVGENRGFEIKDEGRKMKFVGVVKLGF